MTKNLRISKKSSTFALEIKQINSYHYEKNQLLQGIHPKVT